MNLNALTEQLALLFVILFVGYFAAKLRLLPQNSSKVLADLVVNITCPATTLCAVANSTHAMSNTVVLAFLGITAAVLLGQILLGKLFTRALRLNGPTGGAYQFMLVFSNCGFLGYPVVQALLGSDAVFIASIYNLVFQLLCFTYGIRLVAGDPEKVRIRPIFFCKPMIITAVLALVLYMANVPFHPAIVKALSLLDPITSPASMLALGCLLATYPIKKVFGSWKIYVFTFVRLIVIPVAVWAALLPFIKDELILGVLTVISGLPAATNTALLCTKYDGDEATAASGIFISTLLCMVTLPVLLMILF